MQIGVRGRGGEELERRAGMHVRGWARHEEAVPPRGRRAVGTRVRHRRPPGGPGPGPDEKRRSATHSRFGHISAALFPAPRLFPASPKAHVMCAVTASPPPTHQLAVTVLGNRNRMPASDQRQSVSTQICLSGTIKLRVHTFPATAKMMGPLISGSCHCVFVVHTVLF